MTYVGVDIPLSILVGILFTSLRKKKTLIVSTLKNTALKDCISTSQDMISASFSKHILIHSFITLGMIDEQTKTCPDMYVIKGEGNALFLL